MPNTALQFENWRLTALRVTPSITGVISVITDPRSPRPVDPRRNLRNFLHTGELRFGISKRARNLRPDLHPVPRLEGSPKRGAAFPSFQSGQLIPGHT